MNIDRITDLEIKLKAKTEEIAEMRSNIAKDFHDEMGNKLASINILTQSIALQLQNENSEALTLLKTIEKRSKELYDGTKDFIWSIDLRNDNIYVLFNYTREFGERFFNPLGISCVAECNYNSTTTKRLNPNETRQFIYIMKEVFTNAAKHSNCSEIHINFSIENNKLLINIKDNGEGFSENHKLGNGISNINLRVKKSNAEIKFETTKTGTKYVFLIPIE
jgi:signal transduction histidine kinase